jgi:hypothetical protein
VIYAVDILNVSVFALLKRFALKNRYQIYIPDNACICTGGCRRSLR